MTESLARVHLFDTSLINRGKGHYFDEEIEEIKRSGKVSKMLSGAPSSEAEPEETLMTIMYPAKGLSSRRRLSRMITQPRAFYESLETDGGISLFEHDQDTEPANVDDLCQVLQTRDLLNTSKRSPLDGTNTRDNPVHETQVIEVRSTGEGLSTSSQNDDTRPRGRITEDAGKRRVPQRSRTRRVVCISQLETTINELETTVSTLSSQVSFLDQQRWILQSENFILKQKMAQLSQDQILKEDQSEELRKELHHLRLEQQQQQQVSAQSAEGTQKTGNSFEHQLANTGNSPGYQGLDNSPSSEDQRPNTRNLHGSGNQGPMANACTENEDQGANAANLHEDQGLNCGSFHEDERQDNASSQWAISRGQPNSSSRDSAETEHKSKLVKWPSSLYRSVSAIRRDVLENVSESNQHV